MPPPTHGRHFYLAVKRSIDCLGFNFASARLPPALRDLVPGPMFYAARDDVVFISGLSRFSAYLSSAVIV
jgi:hypothetical protein